MLIRKKLVKIEYNANYNKVFNICNYCLILINKSILFKIKHTAKGTLQNHGESFLFVSYCLASDSLRNIEIPISFVETSFPLFKRIFKS